MRPRKIRKKLIILFFTLSALLLLMINAVLIWVITGPRSLAMVKPYLESALSATDGSYNVRIGSSLLSWDGWENPIAIHIVDVKVNDAKDAPIAAFPDVAIRVNLFKLAIGKLDVKSVEVNNPFLLLFQAEDGSMSLGFAEPAAQDMPAATPAPVNSLAASLAAFSSTTEDTPITRLQSIAIRHARIAIKNARSGIFFESKEAMVDIHRIWGITQGAFTLPLEFEGKAGKVEASLTVDGGSETINAETNFSNVPSALLRELFPAQKWMQAANMPLSGEATMRADFEGHVISLPFKADAGPGMVDYPLELEQKLAVKKIHLEGELSKRFSALNLTSGLLDFGQVALAFSGKFRREGDDYAVDAAIHTGPIPLDALRNYWPKSVSPHTRAWVGERVSKGEVEKADVSVHFKPGELKMKDTPHDALNAVMEVKGATVLYMPKNPPVTEVDGRIEFTGDSMGAKVSSASYLTGMKITSAQIRLPNLNLPDVPLFLDMDVNGPAKDIQTFLALPSLNKAKKLGLTEDITGTAKGNAKIDFIAFSDHEDENKEMPDINYAVSATLEHVSQTAFLGKQDVDDANVKVEVNNKGLKASGKANINKLPMEIVSETVFNKGDDTSYSIKTVMPVTRMPDFGLPKLESLKGSMGVEASFVSTDAKDSAKAKLDLTRTIIDLHEHGYRKPDGEKATLELATEHMPSGNTLVPHFALKAENYEASGKAEIEKGKGDFRSLVFDRITAGGHDLDYLEYGKTQNGFKIVARGSTLDLTPYRENMSKGGKAEGIEADIDVDRLIVADKRELYNVTAFADCPDACDEVEVKAELSDKTPVTYSIKGGQVESACANAGELLRALNVYDGMVGGALTLSGEYKGRRIAGKVLIKDFTLKNAPLLTKIFSVTSLTGIMDTLAGNGIAFDKMVAPYDYERGNIIVKDAKQYGSAIGITATGSISLPQASYNMEGTLVPSYTLNSLVGKIPLVGNIIVGGDGKGLIALTYSVKGPMANPSVSANPLSVLTPGFLRGVFDIFDKPAPSLEQMEAQQKKAEAKKKPAKSDAQ